MATKIKLSRDADVLDTALVRQILYSLSYGARRDGDYLVVYDKEHANGSSLYVKEEKNEDGCDDRVIVRLYCDEGFQSDCLHTDGTVHINSRWIEMCSMNPVLRLIIDRFNTEFKPESSPYIGGGSSARHYYSQYIAELDRFGAENIGKFNEIFELPLTSRWDREEKVAQGA